MGNKTVLSRVLSAALVVAPAVAAAEGEVDYRAEVCGRAHGSPPPTFSTLLDLPVLFSNIALYTLDPSQLYGPSDPWTNWYRETDMRKQLGKLASMRSLLEENNLWDVYRFAEPATSSCPASAKTTRQIDGTCNDLTKTWMGAAGTRFQRNMDPTGSISQAETTTLMSPNPRTVSRELFTRDSYKSVPFLNLLAASWIQFNVHDWFNHTTTQLDFMDVPLDPADPIAKGGATHMRVARTAPEWRRAQRTTGSSARFSRRTSQLSSAWPVPESRPKKPRLGRMFRKSLEPDGVAHDEVIQRAEQRAEECAAVARQLFRA